MFYDKVVLRAQQMPRLCSKALPAFTAGSEFFPHTCHLFCGTEPQNELEGVSHGHKRLSVFPPIPAKGNEAPLELWEILNQEKSPARPPFV